jgi:hypothetical protein
MELMMNGSKKPPRAPKRRISEMTPVKAPWVDGWTNEKGRWEHRDDTGLDLINIASGQNRPFLPHTARVNSTLFMHT